MVSSADSRRKELLHLYEWCCIVLEALAQLGPGMEEARAGRMHGLDEALKRGWVSPFWQAKNDLLEWAHGLNPAQRARIDQALRSKFGTGLPENKRFMGQEVKAIVRRGVIKDENEFRVLQSWVGIIEGDPKKRRELGAVTRLMGRFLTGRD